LSRNTVELVTLTDIRVIDNRPGCWTGCAGALYGETEAARLSWSS